MYVRVLAWVLAAWALSRGFATLAAGDLPSKFTNQGSIANTRHNMTQRQASGGGPSGVMMDPYRNDYGEVCVYCHTPHGASSRPLPLWNRTIQDTAYRTYDLLETTTLTQAVSQPGARSLACLSCHDGQVAIDSVINMPGSGGYLASQATNPSNAFLNDWNNATIDGNVHMTMVDCMACHSADAGYVLGAGATDFTVMMLGTDLTNDHPVAVRYPDPGPAVDFRALDATRGVIRFFDLNGNGRPDKDEIRVYSTADGFQVECSSCHDPHGVPSGGPGSVFQPTFLRRSNAASSLCLACHTK